MSHTMPRFRLFNALNLFKLYGALLVVMAHYAPVFFDHTEFFSFGTGIFFVAAGFYALGWESRRGLHYFLSRLLRLYPGYLLAVAVYAVVIQPDGLVALLGHHVLFLLSASTRETVFALNAPFWSMPVFFTFFMMVAFVPLPRPGWVGVALLTLLPLLLLVTHATDWRNGYLELLAFPLHFYAFWLGGLLASRWHVEAVESRWAGAAALTVLFVVLATGAFYPWVRDLSSWSPMVYREVMVFVHALLLWLLLHSPWLSRRLPWLDLLGTISFGIFLYHNLAARLVHTWLEGAAGALVALCLAMGLAWLSWRLVERPLQRCLKPVLARCFGHPSQSAVR